MRASKCSRRGARATAWPGQPCFGTLDARPKLRALALDNAAINASPKHRGRRQYGIDHSTAAAISQPIHTTSLMSRHATELQLMGRPGQWAGGAEGSWGERASAPGQMPACIGKASYQIGIRPASASWRREAPASRVANAAL